MKASEYALAVAILVSPATLSYTLYRIAHVWRHNRRDRRVRRITAGYGRSR